MSSATPFHDATQSVRIQGCPECGADVDLTDADPLTDVACPACGKPITTRGKLGRYKPMVIAGRGGMGIVYKAFDPLLNRNVAIKLLRKEHAENAKLIEDFTQEAAITATVAHANVGCVFATGSDHGRFYLVMELLEHGSLQDLMSRQGVVGELQALQIGIDVACGLRAANERGLVHRDVKPGNILFAEAQRAKIIDFGLAIFEKEAQQGIEEVWGTPYYLPPERLDSMPEDFRGDMYSLGATLFHAMAGRPPFEGRNLMLVALKRLKSQAVSLQSFAPHISKPTAYAINRMLAKDPDQRFSSYDELIQNLEYARNELLQSLKSNSQSSVPPVQKAPQPHARKMMVFACVGLVVLMLGIAVLWPKKTPELEPAIPSVVSEEADSPPVAKPVGTQENEPDPVDKVERKPAIANRMAAEPEDGGIYFISNQETNKILMIGERQRKMEDGVSIRGSENRGYSTQQWKAKKVDADSFIFLVMLNGKALTAGGVEGNVKEGSPICQMTDNGSDAQTWKLIPVGNNCFNLVAKSSGLSLTMDPVVSILSQAGYEGKRNQHWRFLRSSEK